MLSNGSGELSGTSMIRSRRQQCAADVEHSSGLMPRRMATSGQAVSASRRRASSTSCELRAEPEQPAHDASGRARGVRPNWRSACCTDPRAASHRAERRPWRRCAPYQLVAIRMPDNRKPTPLGTSPNNRRPHPGRGDCSSPPESVTPHPGNHCRSVARRASCPEDAVGLDMAKTSPVMWARSARSPSPPRPFAVRARQADPALPGAARAHRGSVFLRAHDIGHTGCIAAEHPCYPRRALPQRTSPSPRRSALHPQGSSRRVLHPALAAADHAVITAGPACPTSADVLQSLRRSPPSTCISPPLHCAVRAHRLAPRR